jgi:hypothetical protein
LILPVKRKKTTTWKGREREASGGKGSKKGSVKPEDRSPVIVVNRRAGFKAKPKLEGKGSKDGASSSAVAGAGAEGSGSAPPVPDAPVHRKLSLLKPKAPGGQSAAVTRVKKRKVEVVEKMDERQPETKMKQQPVSGLVPAQNAAATRVKKRKVNEREMMMEPPLKRVKRLKEKERRGSSANGVGGGESSSKEQEKSLSPKRKGRPSRAKGIKWPAKMRTGEGRQKVTCLLRPLHRICSFWGCSLLNVSSE